MVYLFLDAGCLQPEKGTESLGQLTRCARGRATIAVEVVSLSAVLLFSYKEACLVWSYGKHWPVLSYDFHALELLLQVSNHSLL